MMRSDVIALDKSCDRYAVCSLFGNDRDALRKAAAIIEDEVLWPARGKWEPSGKIFLSNEAQRELCIIAQQEGLSIEF